MGAPEGEETPRVNRSFGVYPKHVEIAGKEDGLISSSSETCPHFIFKDQAPTDLLKSNFILHLFHGAFPALPRFRELGLFGGLPALTVARNSASLS